jgi:hypothetical protein
MEIFRNMAVHLILFAIDMYQEFPKIFLKKARSSVQGILLHDGAVPEAGDLTVYLYECEVFSHCVYSPAL